MIRIVTDGEYATVAFAYDPRAVEIIKAVPVHRWDPDAKRWTTETSWVQLLARRYTDQGYTVEIDGDLWRPENPAAVTGPALPALFDQLPDRLRSPVYKALARVLHPDAGGDTALMQQLNQANQRRGQ